MFYFILGFGVGFYVCYLVGKIKLVKKDKKSSNSSDDKKVVNEEKK